MFNGQMLFDRQMHVKIVRNVYCLRCFEKGTTNKTNTCCLQDEKSLPPEDFRQVEKSSPLPRE